MSAPNTNFLGIPLPADRRVAVSRSLFAEREIPMPTVPPDLFRRKLAHRALTKIEAAIRAFDELAQTDNTVAAEAGYLDIAVTIARKLKREDLAQEFEARRQEVVVRALTAKPIRRSRKRMRRMQQQEEKRPSLRPDDHISDTE